MDKGLLMNKIIAGHASLDEQKEFAAWVSENDQNRQEFEDVKFLIENADHAERNQEDPFYDDWYKIKNRIGFIQKRNRILRTLKTVLSIILLLVVLYFIFRYVGIWTSSGQTWNFSQSERPLTNSSRMLAFMILRTNAPNS